MHSGKNFEANFNTNFARQRNPVDITEQEGNIKVWTMALNTTVSQLKLNFTCSNVHWKDSCLRASKIDINLPFSILHMIEETAEGKPR